MKVAPEFWVLVSLVLVLAALRAGWGALVYHDWTCGMPGVQCRKVVRLGQKP